MGINIDDWLHRVGNRTDMTSRLVHLTKPSEVFDDLSWEEINVKAVDNLIKILKDGKLIGSGNNGYIIGNIKAVCFQDVPLYGVAQNVEYEKNRREMLKHSKLRYCGVGLSFVKPYLYHDANARPVIYENKDIAKNLIHEDEYWRIVSLDYKELDDSNWDIVDWTHEREWRIKGDLEFDIDLLGVHIIVYNPECYQYFMKKYPEEIKNKILGITVLTTIYN